jgi:hypothetical protein
MMEFFLRPVNLVGYYFAVITLVANLANASHWMNWDASEISAWIKREHLVSRAVSPVNLLYLNDF